MTYEEFSTKQKQILEECKPLMRDFKLDEFDAKMQELIALNNKYLKERNEMQRKGGQSKSNKKTSASRENGKKGGRPRSRLPAIR